jgi:DNA-binding transcriptional regulator YiaG
MSSKPMTPTELKQLRQDAKVSRDDVAERTGYSTAMIQRVEEGRREMPEEFEAAFRQAVAEITRERHERALAATAA